MNQTKPTTDRHLSRRDVLKLTAAATLLPLGYTEAKTPKKVIIAGGGIGGLSCGWELVRRGHDVVVLEAAGRTGGHVFTYREGLDDGLYADGGAEHFTKPGYDRYWGYVHEFDLAHRYYPRRERILRWYDGKMYTQEMLADPKVLDGFGFNRREVEYLTTHPWPELAGLYYAPYMDAFADEYKPFDAGLNRLDAMTTTELFRKDGASDAALQHIGGGGSALQSVWHAAILKIRGVPLFPKVVYRLVGGNQKLPDTFTDRLGDRVRLESPVTAIEHGQTGVKVTCRVKGQTVVHEGDYLVCAMSAVMLRNIPVTPKLPETKAWAVSNVPYYFDTRPVFQTRTKFWEKDGLTPTMEFNVRELNHVWATCDEVETTRGLIVGTSTGPQTPETTLAAYKRLYPGKTFDVEKAKAVVWSTNPWASACETTAYAPGTLTKYWPALFEPVGRIHFCGAYADNLNWGQEAATRSAFRAATAIDGATT
jgi:monoamine oxidase